MHTCNELPPLGAASGVSIVKVLRIALKHTLSLIESPSCYCLLSIRERDCVVVLCESYRRRDRRSLFDESAVKMLVGGLGATRDLEMACPHLEPKPTDDLMILAITVPK